ncbi:MAG: D-alanyl-D-alanine endopeptidase [Glaciihabitans sp.]|nr:D-alanyl-D-alanine endopeptidase [Glaciihabitans sp.]
MYRRRRTTIFGAAVVVLAAGFYLPLTLLAPLEAVPAEVAAYTAPISTAAAPTAPAYGASGIGEVGATGLLASAGSTEALPIASISKIITTLVVLNAKPLTDGSDGPTISFTRADVQIYNDYVAENGSVKPVSAGMQLTQREVIELALVGSANNYTQSLVNWAFGSEDEYVTAASAWLAAHNLTSTSVSDATGISPKNTSTPTDLVALGALALADPVVSSIVSQPTVTVPVVGTFNNTNNLLGIDGIDGIKTGTLDEAGACLLFSADVQVGDTSITLVGVVLGGSDHDTVDEDVRSLLASVVDGFHEVQLTAAGQEFGSYSTEWGEATTLVAAESASAVVWSDSPVTAVVTAEPLSLATAGEDAGSVAFSVGGQTVDVPLEVAGTMEAPSAWWRLTHPGDLF